MSGALDGEVVGLEDDALVGADDGLVGLEGAGLVNTEDGLVGTRGSSTSSVSSVWVGCKMSKSNGVTVGSEVASPSAALSSGVSVVKQIFKWSEGFVRDRNGSKRN